MGDFPTSVDEAKVHIEKIRHQKLQHVGSSSAILESALSILSDQLYTTSSHFLLEIIQNADDNNYDHPTPTLNITYHGQFLHFECNEIGFSMQNVEALCAMGASSKKQISAARQYTGEKGIGFKSVFRVADTVWIGSGHYTFHLTKTGKLGMIAPVWSDLPLVSKPGFTSIILSLSTETQNSGLDEVFRSLDISIFIFLQQLKNINIIISGSNTSPWSKKISRQQEDIPNPKPNIITLQEDDSIHSFTVITQQIQMKIQREGFEVAHVSIAFPTDVKGNGDCLPQLVYNCLPIRDYGFKFLLHSDFILTANRQDIDQSSAWNQEICKALPEAITWAIKSLNQTSLRYQWPQYLPSRTHTDDAFRIVDESFANVISEEAVVESLSGVLNVPGKLLHVPAQFQDASGIPLSSYSENNLRYVSIHYSSYSLLQLKMIGVGTMSPRQFVDDISLFINGSYVVYQKKGQEWHSYLARALISVMSSNPELTQKILKLPLIPLRDGRWVTGQAAREGSVVFPMESADLSIPDGIGLSVVEPGASQNEHRKSLFLVMGCHKLAVDEVSAKLCTTHEMMKRDEVSNSILVAQALFLFKAKWKSPSDTTFWFVTETGGRSHGTSLYIHSDRQYAASKYLHTNVAQDNFLHKMYFDTVSCDKDELSNWLVDSFRLSYLPRLVQSTVFATKPFILSSDFSSLIDRLPAIEILMMLKTHWEQYCEWLSRERLQLVNSYNIHWELSRKDLIRHFTSLLVPCRGGGFTQLCRTALPIPRYLEDDTLVVDFLDVPDPEDEGWNFLGRLGVLVGGLDSLEYAGTKVESYLTRLRELRRLKEPEITEITNLYEIIWKEAGTEARLIRNAFEMEPLIYIPPSQHCSVSGWLRSGRCRWSGPGALKKTPRISITYPGLRDFFCTTLPLQDADLGCIAQEVLLIGPSDGLQYILTLLQCFSQQLSVNQEFLESQLDLKAQLLKYRIFPVVTQPLNSMFDFDCLASANETDIWFVADRTHLRRCFEGVVHLLAIDTNEISKIDHLLSTLNLQHRRLSQRASRICEIHGNVEIDDECTQSIREKAPFIFRLVPRVRLDRTDLANLLRTITIHRVEKIYEAWTVKNGDNEVVPGRPGDGTLKIVQTDMCLEVYLQGPVSGSQLLPVELVEHLASAIGIVVQEDVILLQYILSEFNLDNIIDTLDRRGILEDAADAHLFSDENLRIKTIRSGRSRQGNLNALEREALAAFLDDVEQAHSVRRMVSRRWEANSLSELKPLLSRICHLDKQDVSLYLPQSDMDNSLGGSDRTNDVHEVAYLTSGLLDEYEQQSRTSLFLPAIVAITKQRKPKFRILSPAINAQDPEILFLGELYMSQMLERFMGSSYDPGKEWTSRLRTRAGFKPYENVAKVDLSAFTIYDRGGSFTRILTRHGYRGSVRWAIQRTFHLDLITIEGPLDGASFYLHPRQLEKARRCYIEGTLKDRPESIAVLAIVFNVNGIPQIALLVDPWRLFLQGHIDLLIESHSLAVLQNVPPMALILENGDQRTASVGAGQHIRPYVYTPLSGFKMFRLLRLLPGPYDSILKGEITVHSHASTPTYKALSYPWGTGLKPYRLHMPDGFLSITASCDSALRSIRERDHTVTLWVDAVCIDQDNNHEKVTQIRLMRDIFQSAELVYAWIGKPSSESDLCFNTLLQIQAQQSNIAEWPSNVPAIPQVWIGQKVPAPSDAAWDAIDATLNREWFKRVWITQEVVVATKVVIICGSLKMDWEEFSDAIEICKKELLSMVESGAMNTGAVLQSLTPALTIAHTRNLYSNTAARSNYTLLKLFELFSHTKSSLEVDKIFGFLGLAADAESNDFNPDYDSSFEDVIRKFANAFVARGHILELLHRSGTTKSYDFCSWIPAWTRAPYPRSISTWHSRNGPYAASGSIIPYSHGNTGKLEELNLSCVFVDSVASVGDNTLQQVDIWTFLKSLHTLIDSLGTYPTGEPLENIKLLLPIGNASRPYLEPSSNIHLNFNSMSESDLNEKIQWTNSTPSFTSVQKFIDFFRQPDNLRSNNWKYWQTVSAFSARLCHARYIRTERGYAGLAPSAVEPQDLVVLLHGGSVPFIIKRAAQNEELYNLVGECYVHGLMHGEALGLNGVKERIIALR